MMCAKDEDSISQKLVKTLILILSVIMLSGIFLVTTLASTGKNEVPGKVYEFDKDSHYEFSGENQFAETGEDNTYGVFSVSGNISDVGSKNGVPVYEVAEGNLSLFYNHGDTLLNADVDSWHLIDDKSKKVDALSLDDNILKGVIILQTSKDRLTWSDEGVITNAFSEKLVRTDAIYSTTDVQLINGCFYRIISVC